ncbi:MAG: reverse transcriptase family protein [Desulfovibrio sp.]|jgi:hypothetical protein
MPTVNKICYPKNQCCLYKVTTKKKLANLIGVTQEELVDIAKDNSRLFETFELAPVPLLSHPLFVKKAREIQRIKPPLSRIHKRIFHLLRFMETPCYLHSAVKGKSYATNVQAHLYASEALKLDIKSFYPSITWIKIYNFFAKTMCCQPDVAFLLSNICSCNGHLPTGSSLSPLLSFLVNETMFDSLERVASKFGLAMTVYVDDIMFSGKYIGNDFEKRVKNIIQDHGYECHKMKKFKKNAVKLITGLAIRNGTLDVPFRRCAKVRILMEAIQLDANAAKRDRLVTSLRGMVNEMKRFNKGFAQHVICTAGLPH